MWERVPAVQGKNITPEFRNGENKRARDRKLTFTEMGCLLSHVSIWEKIVEQHIDAALIMEDDVIFSPVLKEILADLSWLPSDDCVIRLETFMMRGVLGKAVATVCGRGLHRLYSIQHGGAAYILTRKRAQALLDANRRFTDTTDHLLFRYPLENNAYQLMPAPCIQYSIHVHGHLSGQSNLESERVISQRLSLYEPDTVFKHARWKTGSLLGIALRVLAGYRFCLIPFKK